MGWCGRAWADELGDSISIHQQTEAGAGALTVSMYVSHQTATHAIYILNKGAWPHQIEVTSETQAMGVGGDGWAPRSL